MSTTTTITDCVISVDAVPILSLVEDSVMRMAVRPSGLPIGGWIVGDNDEVALIGDDDGRPCAPDGGLDAWIGGYLIEIVDAIVDACDDGIVGIAISNIARAAIAAVEASGVEPAPTEEAS